MSNENPDANRVVAGSTDTPTYTVSWDWAWMSALPDAAFRIYSCVRAYVIEGKADEPVELTDDFIAHETDRSVSAVKRARKVCYEHGALAEVSCYSESVPPSAPGKKPTVRTVRKLQVAVQPPAGYTGPVNCFTERARFEAKKKQKARSGTAAPVDNSCHRSDLNRDTDQGKRRAHSVSAGHSHGSDLHEARSDLHEPSSNLHSDTPADQGKRPPELKGEIKNQPTKRPANDSSKPTAPVEPDTGGWMESSAKENRTTATVGGALLRKIADQHAPTFTNAGIAKHAPTVDAALGRGYTSQQLTTKLGDGLKSATNPAGALTRRVKDLATEPQRKQAEQHAVAKQAQQCRAQAEQDRAQRTPRQTTPDQVLTGLDTAFLPTRLQTN